MPSFQRVLSNAPSNHGQFLCEKKVSNHTWYTTSDLSCVHKAHRKSLPCYKTFPPVLSFRPFVTHPWARPSLFFLHTRPWGAIAWSKGYLSYAMDVPSKWNAITFFQTSALKYLCMILAKATFFIIIFGHKSFLPCLQIKVPRWI